MKCKKAQSLLEVIIGLAIFSLLAAVIIAMALGSFRSFVLSRHYLEASFLAQEAIEAIRSINEAGWNEIVFSPAVVEVSEGKWRLLDLPDQTTGLFTRTILLEDVCRDQDDELTSCPGAYLDVYAKKITVIVEWQELTSFNNKVERTTYLTNWDSSFWAQEDWSGGGGQTTAIDPSRYDNSVNVDASFKGQISLSSSNGGCSGYLWSFDNQGDYLYDPEKIEVSQSLAKLVLREEGCGGSALDCSSFDEQTACLKQKECLWQPPECYGEPAACQNLGEEACFSCGCQATPGFCSGDCSCWQRGVSQADCQCDGLACSWRNTFGGFCYGNCSCDTAATQACCESHGCLWTPGTCSGEPLGCSSHSGQSQCSNCGCLWASGVCFGNALACDSFSDALSCESQESCSWRLDGYALDKPSIRPQLSYVSAAVDLWTGFSETAVKNGGEIYYQLSDNDGLSWYWWDGEAWSLAQQGDFNTALVVDQHIKLFDSSNKRLIWRAFLESDGFQEVVLDEVSLECASINLQMEAGRVFAGDEWTRVNLSNQYYSPIVVASVLENNNNIPCSVRIRNLLPNSFELRLQSPSGRALNGEEIDYWVVEEGVWDLDGLKIEARQYQTSTVGSKNNWDHDNQFFLHNFSNSPLVFHQVMSFNDSGWITTFVSSLDSRLDPPDSNGLAIGLNGSEAASEHGEETIGWIAIEKDAIKDFNSNFLETRQMLNAVRGHDDGCDRFGFALSYSEDPLVFGSQQTIRDKDGGWSMVCYRDNFEAGFHVEEDQVLDFERRHQKETFAMLVFDAPFRYSESNLLYADNGWLISSAFDMGKPSSIQAIEWDALVPPCGPMCRILFQIQTAPDNEGQPGPWSSTWCGPDGEDGDETDFFTQSKGELIHRGHNGDQWIRYRVFLYGDTLSTPILREVRVNYK